MRKCALPARSSLYVSNVSRRVLAQPLCRLLILSPPPGTWSVSDWRSGLRHIWQFVRVFIVRCSAFSVCRVFILPRIACIKCSAFFWGRKIWTSLNERRMVDDKRYYAQPAQTTKTTTTETRTKREKSVFYKVCAHMLLSGFQHLERTDIYERKKKKTRKLPASLSFSMAASTIFRVLSDINIVVYSRSRSRTEMNYILYHFRSLCAFRFESESGRR